MLLEGGMKFLRTMMNNLSHQDLKFKQVALFLTKIALLLLPFSHFKWLPNLGLTRPITSVLFVFALFILLLPGIMSKSWSLPMVPGWNVLQWFFLLMIMGVISVFFTLFYGNVMQALIRLLG